MTIRSAFASVVLILASLTVFFRSAYCEMVPLQDVDLTPDFSVYELDNRRNCRLPSRFGDTATLKLSAYSPGLIHRLYSLFAAPTFL